jgi:hypothetical protein
MQTPRSRAELHLGAAPGIKKDAADQHPPLISAVTML